jgi:glycosyltransferase involved in cell wall biosynthesis
LDLNKNKTFNIIFPHPPGAGGPGSFQTRFEKELKQKGNKIAYKGAKVKPDIILVVGGTKKLLWLFLMKLKGVPIIYRLDGIGWLHKKRKTSLSYYWTAELRNFLSKAIHAFIATKIVYQSQFVKEWWDNSGWRQRKDFDIIHNGVVVPESNFLQERVSNRPTHRLVVLEGVIDYTPYAIDLLNELAEKLPENIQIELYGKFEHHQPEQHLHKRLIYKGFLKREDVYEVFKGSVYLSLDIHPACPNTVAEALACGAPVAAFDTGSLSELVDESCGRIVNYGSNPWELSYPNVDDLIESVIKLFSDYNYFSKNAYQKANRDYSINGMFRKYDEIIKEIIK